MTPLTSTSTGPKRGTLRDHEVCTEGTEEARRDPEVGYGGSDETRRDSEVGNKGTEKNPEATFDRKTN